MRGALKPGDLCAWNVKGLIDGAFDGDGFPLVVTLQRIGVVLAISHSAIRVRERGGPLRDMERGTIQKIERIPAEEYERPIG